MTDQDELLEVLTPKEAADILRMSLRSLAKRRRQGRIQFFQDERYITYNAEHLAEYLRTNRRGSPEQRAQNEQILLSLRRYTSRLTKQRFPT
jgi:predicted nucleotidyltransferase